MALANIALDQLGQARALLAHAGRLEDAGRGEDELAYLRDEREFRNVKLVERPQADFGVAVARLLLVATWQSELYAALVASTDATLAAVAGKAVKEVAYHLDHARQWTLRLGDGTAESARRMQAAVDAEWPYLEELFEPVDPGLLDAGIAVDPTAAAPRRAAAASSRCSPRPPSPSPRPGPPSGAGAAACTPSTSATCSPRCSTCTDPTRRRRGDHPDAGLGRPGGSPPRCPTPSCRS